MRFLNKRIFIFKVLSGTEWYKYDWSDTWKSSTFLNFVLLGRQLNKIIQNEMMTKRYISKWYKSDLESIQIKIQIKKLMN